MTSKTQEFMKAATLTAMLATTATSAAANNSGSYARGWDKPELAEFVMQNIDTKFLTGEPNVTRDVHIDCDLLVKDGGKRFPTTGFAIQFNAETDRTYQRLGEEVMSRLQAWMGQLDYRKKRVQGTIVHLEGAHGISRKTVGAAFNKCVTEFPEHGVDIKRIGKNVEGIHPSYIK